MATGFRFKFTSSKRQYKAHDYLTSGTIVLFCALVKRQLSSENTNSRHYSYKKLYIKILYK